MYIESRIIDFLNNILSKVQEKTCFLADKSFILSNIEEFLFGFIILSLLGNIFLNNNFIAPLLCIVAILYFLTLILKKGIKIQLNKSSLFLLLYFVLTVASTINSTMPKESVYGLSKTILYLLYFLAVFQYLKLHKDRIYILSGIIGICVSFEIIIAFIQNYTNVLSTATWQDTSRLNPELVLTRVYGTLKPSNPNLFGGYLIASVPFLWMFSALSYLREKYNQFLISLFFSILSIPAIFMTGCRGAYIALFVMIFLFFVFLYIFLKKFYNTAYLLIKEKKNYIIGLISVLFTGIIICVPKIAHRILSIFAMRNDSSTSFRMNVYHSSIQMFQDNFLLGIGCGNKVFREIYGLYMLSGFDALSAYCIFLEIAVESGIFALIFFLLFLFYLIKNGIKIFIENLNIEENISIIFCILCISGILIHGFFDTIYFRPQVQLIFWIAVALIYAHFDNYKSKNS